MQETQSGYCLVAAIFSWLVSAQALAFCLAPLPVIAAESGQPTGTGGLKISEIKGLATLAPFERKLDLGKAEGLHYFQFGLSDGTQVSLLHYAPVGARPRLRLAAKLGLHTEPTSEQARLSQAVAALNGGYFNLSDGKSASYVIVGGATEADPKNNQALVQNPKLKAFLPSIFNRSELRVVEDRAGQVHYVIAAHDEPLNPGLKLVDSLQGGPRLLPNLTASEEAFLRIEEGGGETDSIELNGRPHARPSA